MKMIGVRMEDELFRKLKIKQTKSGKTMQDYMIDMIEFDVEQEHIQTETTGRKNLMMRTLCIRMEEELFKKMKQRQIKSGKTVQRYVTELIEKDLKLAQMQKAKEENNMYIDAGKEVYELAEIDDIPVLFTHARIDRKTVPMGFFCYDVRESEGFSGIPASLEPSVGVDHWGTVLSRQEFPMENGFYQIGKDGMNYLGETMTAAEYIETEQRQEQEQMHGGMELK